MTIQAQILNEMKALRDREGTAILLVTHDLGVVAGVADRVLVMYAGKAVERGTAADVFYRSRHPYTKGLLSSLPRIDGDVAHERLRAIEGSPPSLIDLPPGCSFHPRCPFARCPSPCATDEPPLRLLEAPCHWSACHFAEEASSTGSVLPTASAVLPASASPA